MILAAFITLGVTAGIASLANAAAALINTSGDSRCKSMLCLLAQ